MTVNERVKHLRKEILHLSQTEFAKQLGMKQTGVSGFERPGATMTDQTIRSICLVFNVNEEWLRNGTGEVFSETKAFSLDDFAKARNMSDLELQILKVYFELDSDIREVVLQHFKDRLAAQEEPPETPGELEEKYPPVDGSGSQAG